MSELLIVKQNANDLVTVCDQCLRASCWQGEFMCEDARDAGTIQKTRAELRTLRLESSDYWKTDKELTAGNAKAAWGKRGTGDWKHRALAAERRIDIAINSCKDVTSLGRFSVSVDPVGWVKELQAHLEEK